MRRCSSECSRLTWASSLAVARRRSRCTCARARSVESLRIGSSRTRERLLRPFSPIRIDASIRPRHRASRHARGGSARRCCRCTARHSHFAVGSASTLPRAYRHSLCSRSAFRRRRVSPTRSKPYKPRRRVPSPTARRRSTSRLGLPGRGPTRPIRQGEVAPVIVSAAMTSRAHAHVPARTCGARAAGEARRRLRAQSLGGGVAVDPPRESARTSFARTAPV